MNDQNLKLASKWIKGCLKSHPMCKAFQPQKPEWRPTRLVYVGSESQQPKLVLSDNGSASAPYIALSYCWGSGSNTMLTKEKLGGFQKEIPLESLPTTIQEAVSTTRNLGYEYIWVDALCIIQDFKQDWIAESSKMSDIYGSAVVTLAAAGNSNVNDSMFFRRDPRIIRPCVANIGDKQYQRVSYPWAIYPNQPERLLADAINESPLSRRAWALQELLLSPKTLVFGRKQMVWSCCTTEASETFPLGLDPKFATPLNEAASLLHLRQRLMKISKADELPSEFWSDFIPRFTKANLTVGSDTLVALQGLVERIIKKVDKSQDSAGMRPKLDYAAGLWRDRNFQRSLLWRTTTGSSRRPERYRAPSWSWASLDGEVESFEGFVTWVWNQKDVELAKIVDVCIKPRLSPSLSLTGQVTAGHIDMESYLRPCHLLKLPANELLSDEGQSEALIISSRQLAASPWLEHYQEGMKVHQFANSCTLDVPYEITGSEWIQVYCVPLQLGHRQTDRYEQSIWESYEGLVLQPLPGSLPDDKEQESEDEWSMAESVDEWVVLPTEIPTFRRIGTFTFDFHDENREARQDELLGPLIHDEDNVPHRKRELIRIVDLLLTPSGLVPISICRCKKNASSLVMHFIGAKAAVFALAFFHSCDALKVTILADTNRDGKVDNDDVAGKSTWTATKGAVILPNIGDTDSRCAKKWGPSKDILAEGEAYLDQCNDATDNILRNSKFLAPVKTLPLKGLSASAKGSIYVSDKTAASKVRVFAKKAGKWTYVAADYAFTAEELTAGLQIGIDARDVRRPNAWNGNAKVNFVVTNGKTKATDAVAVRVAPVLTHHHGQAAQRILSTGVNEPGSNIGQNGFVNDLKRNIADAGIKEPLFLFDNQDIWTQDFLEPGYATMPGPNGPVAIRIMIRSAQESRRSGRDVFHELRSSTVGAVQHPGDGDTIDSTGNLETIPPYTHNGKSFPAGRVIMGAWDGRQPLMIPFLKAQEVQDPVILDTSWLYVGHVDEFIQFLPARNKLGWVIMVADPIKGLDILKKASKAGHGKVKAVSRVLSAAEKEQAYCTPRQTIDEALQFSNLTVINQHAAKIIEANLNILKRETGITDADIHRVPQAFYYANPGWLCPGKHADGSNLDAVEPNKAASKAGINFGQKSTPGGPSSKAKSIVEAATPKSTLYRRATDEATKVVALYPDAVNGLVIGDSKVIAPNPWGPVINKKDIIAAAVSEVYASVGYNVTYQDDWFSHFLLQGDVHCGSNSWRAMDNKLSSY
ncbi:hypothetical protein F53441_4946 [Fusarium austroafricanum]|uniref:Protein-arginine deiminase C-terminal domain-containing protein n=1 Tax=Fusarium austroafricanum TaxID=2364996 RepID=A0A8H4P178_9HYPO|nr:hypothetical protein F53441_4946 [Fusarium austroafricanum]